MGKTKIKTIDDSAQAEEKKPSKKKAKDQLSVLSDQLSDTGSPVVSQSVEDSKTEQQKTDQPTSENGKQKTDNRKSQKPGKAKPRSKKYQEVSKDLDRTKTYPLSEAIDLVKKLSYSKFDGTLEVHIKTVQTGIRGLVSLPYSSGKKLTNGTITSGQAGKTEYKTESKAPIIHLGLGKLNQPTEELSQNVKTLLQTIGKTRIKQVSLSPTMGPSVKIELSNGFS